MNKNKPIAFIFYGPPGCGKGTTARGLTALHSCAHIETGQEIRDRLVQNPDLVGASEVENGGFADDDLVIQIIEEKLGEIKPDKNIILDGCVRNVEQLRRVRWILGKREMNIVFVWFKLSEQASRQRLGLRPKQEGAPVRKDDREMAIERRFELYHKHHTSMMEMFTRGKVLLVGIDASKKPEEILTRFKAFEEKGYLSRERISQFV